MATVSTQGSPSTAHVPATVETSMADTLKAFEAAFNRQDTREVAAFWEQDGTLLSPMGAEGIGRAGVEKVYAADVATFLRGTRSTFEIDRVRMIGRDHAFLDLTHTISGARMPDGTTGTTRLHLAALARRSGDAWRWVDTRPYAFLPPPQATMH